MPDPAQVYRTPDAQSVPYEPDRLGAGGQKRRDIAMPSHRGAAVISVMVATIIALASLQVTIIHVDFQYILLKVAGPLIKIMCKNLLYTVRVMHCSLSRGKL